MIPHTWTRFWRRPYVLEEFDKRFNRLNRSRPCLWVLHLVILCCSDQFERYRFLRSDWCLFLELNKFLSSKFKLLYYNVIKKVVIVFNLISFIDFIIFIYCTLTCSQQEPYVHLETCIKTVSFFVKSYYSHAWLIFSFFTARDGYSRSIASLYSVWFIWQKWR